MKGVDGNVCLAIRGGRESPIKKGAIDGLRESPWEMMPSQGISLAFLDIYRSALPGHVDVTAIPRGAPLFSNLGSGEYRKAEDLGKSSLDIYPYGIFTFGVA